MSMYNTVDRNCPKCGHSMEMQIDQIVLGFGNFDLHDVASFEELNASQFFEVISEVTDPDRGFVCRNEGCRYIYKFEGSPAPYGESREAIIQKLLEWPLRQEGRIKAWNE